MEYCVYHDESKESGYWHGIYFLPEKSKRDLFDYLQKARENTGFNGVIGLKNVTSKGRKFTLAQSYLLLAVGSLIQNFKGECYPLHLGQQIKNRIQYTNLHKAIGAKFVLFKVKDNHQVGYEKYPDYGSKVETTYRMGLKGGMHYLFDEDNPIVIKKLHFDGHEHYQRHIDKNRIVNRLIGLRDYCNIDIDDNDLDDRSSNHKRQDSQEYDDCQVLQMIDLLVGSFRTLLGNCTKDIHRELAYPVKELIIRYQEGYARMRNSRWFKGFVISQCYIEQGSWVFEPVNFPEVGEQISLEDLFGESY